MKDLNQHYYNTLGLLERCSNIILLPILRKIEKKLYLQDLLFIF